MACEVSEAAALATPQALNQIGYQQGNKGYMIHVKVNMDKTTSVHEVTMHLIGVEAKEL